MEMTIIIGCPLRANVSSYVKTYCAGGALNKTVGAPSGRLGVRILTAIDLSRKKW